MFASSDGLSWSIQFIAAEGTDLMSVTYGGGLWVVVGANSTILYSRDLQTWSAASTVPSSLQLNGVASLGGTRFIAVGGGGTILVTADGDVWTAQASGVTGYLRGIVVDAYGHVFVSGQNGALLEQVAQTGPASAPDWSPVPGSGSLLANLDAMADLGAGDLPTPPGATLTPSFDNLVATGSAGAAVTFSDDFTVTPQISEWSASVGQLDETNTTADLRALAYGDGYVVTGGDNGTLLTSVDGKTWTPAEPLLGPGVATTASYLAAAYSPSLDIFVVVGTEDVILTSTVPAETARLVNLSTRAHVGTGANFLIPGFVIRGNGTETLLIRADGPALSAFGVPGALAEPSLSVFDNDGNVVASNTGWGTNANPAQVAGAATSVGAFALASGSADCALIASLPAGAYTVQVSGVNGTSGVALAEIYEVASTGTRLVNLSTRAQEGTGANIIIPGFAVSGSGTEALLVRAVGPGLGQFGVSGILVKPTLGVFNSSEALVASNIGWENDSDPARLESIAASVGAFALPSGSADSAMMVNLEAGAYTMQVSGVNNSTGIALAEIYEIP
jgi:hypothetical protein